MRKIICFIMIFVLCFNIACPCYADIYYSDIVGHWSASDVNYATNFLKVFNGYNDYTFRPDKEISRSEFITILVRTATKLGLLKEVYVSDMSYLDMNNKQWSYTYVITYYEYMNKNFSLYKFNDIFSGNYFYPDKAITREEAMLLIGALVKDSIYDNDVNFSDIDNSYKYYNQVKSLCNNGILTGYDDTSMKLYKNITRGESAALIRRVYDSAKLLNSKYLTNIQYMPITNEDVLPFFGTYDLATKNVLDKMYIKAKNTLEYLAFAGCIFEEDKHLYDPDPIGTMNNLRNQNYYNVSGVNFYLLKFANLSFGVKLNLANEILLDIVSRTDLNDAEITQLIYLVKNYNVNNTYFMEALSKWYTQTDNKNAIMNIKMLRYEHYIKTGNYLYAKNLIYKDINDSISYKSMTNLNWNISVNDSVDMLNLEEKQLYYSIYAVDDYTDELNPHNENLIILPHYVIVDDIIINSNINLSDEDMFYKYSLNKSYILYTIGEYERAFIELYNDYKIIKNLSIYSTNKAAISESINSILQALKNKM